MRSVRAIKRVLRIIVVLAVLYVVLVAIVYLRQRSMLFFPTHLTSPTTSLKSWMDGGSTIGFCREVTNPAAIWLMLHGNAGQAADRDYVVRCMSDRESLYVLEYPGYGARPGSPCRDAFNQAAREAYELLRTRNPGLPICILGESIGTGPASVLAQEKIPPDKIVLVVPFDSLANVACKKFPCFPVRLMLRDAWDNVASLRQYKGPIDIFAATDDRIIPIEHAKALAGQVPGAKLIPIKCGHNEWSETGLVRISH